MTYHADFDVKGIPKAQPRHQAFAKNVAKKGDPPKMMARVYQAGTAENWKSLVITAGEKSRPPEPLEGPILIRILFWMPRPQRLNRKKDSAGPIPHLAKPDNENLEKPILDCLKNDGWFRDDSIVFFKKSAKFYHARSGAPGAEIYIDELDDTEELVARTIAAVRTLI